MTEQSVICGNCGAANRADAEVCASCGATLAAYRSIAGAPAGADVATPGSTLVDALSASVEVAPAPVTPPDTSPVTPPAVPRDSRPTAHFRHVSYTRPDAGSSTLDVTPTSAVPSSAPLAAADAPRAEATPRPASSVTFPAPPPSPAQPAPPPTGTAATPMPAPKADTAPKPPKSPLPAPQTRTGQRSNGTTDRREPASPGPTPAWRPPEHRRPDRLARTSGSTLITWGVGLVLFGFIISIALPNASHQALGEVIVTLATVVGIVLFVVGLTHRTGARRPGDRRPPRRRR